MRALGFPGEAPAAYHRRLRNSAILTLAALAAFGASLGGSFHLDDYALFQDPAIVSPGGWQWEQTRPLTWFTFRLNYQGGARDPAPYHAVNIVLHWAAALALYWAIRGRLGGGTALAAAGLFAVHPIQAEAVDYVFARGTLLMAVFSLLALGCWLRERRWLAVACFAAALASKEECAALPVVLALAELARRGPRRAWLPIAAMLALALGAGLHVIHALERVAQPTAGFAGPVSWSGYLAAQGWVILRYLRLTVVPWGFHFDPDIRVAAWQAAVGWAAVAALAAVSLRRFRDLGPGFWAIAGLVLLLPSSSVFPAEDFSADRRMYLPLAAFACAAAFLVRRVDWRVTAAALAALAALSFARTQVWMTERSLWEEAVRMAPAKLRPKLQLARAVEPRRALVLLGEARKLAPDDPRVASQTGEAWLRLNRPEMALGEFGRALALAPRDPLAYNNRAVALITLGQREAAAEDLLRALTIDPCLEQARENLRAVSGRNPPPCPRKP
jgi:protein O-mannosyl-transferase